LAIETSVLAIWILLPLSLASIVLLWFMRTRLRTTHGLFHSLLCLFSYLCPSLLVLAGAVLFMTYVPYDESFRKLLSGPFSHTTFRQITSIAYAPFLLPFSVRSAIGLVFDSFFLWSALAATLTLLLVIVGRHLPKRPATHPASQPYGLESGLARPDPGKVRQLTKCNSFRMIFLPKRFRPEVTGFHGLNFEARRDPLFSVTYEGTSGGGKGQQARTVRSLVKSFRISAEKIAVRTNPFRSNT
jgi:hypothetical protein